MWRKSFISWKNKRGQSNNNIIKAGKVKIQQNTKKTADGDSLRDRLDSQKGEGKGGPSAVPEQKATMD